MSGKFIRRETKRDECRSLFEKRQSVKIQKMNYEIKTEKTHKKIGHYKNVHGSIKR